MRILNSYQYICQMSRTFVLVLLTMALLACEDEYPEEGSIPDMTPPTADFTFAAVIGDYQTIVFTNISNSSTDYIWDFGDGQSSEEASPTHVFTMDGTYSIKLIAEDKNGLADTTIQEIEIIEPEDDFVPVILNPSFEDGTANWTNEDLGASFVVFNTFASEGSNAARFAPGVAIYQTITVRPDREYSIAFDFTVNGSVDPQITIRALDKSVTDVADVPGATFKEESYADGTGSVTSFSKGVFAFESGDLEQVALLITTGKDSLVDNFTIEEK